MRDSAFRPAVRAPGATAAAPAVSQSASRAPATSRTAALATHRRALNQAPAVTQLRGLAQRAAAGTIQRYAFIGANQVTRQNAVGLTPKMHRMAKDQVVRQYNNQAEFGSHAAKQTDYLGNLADGTWVRFDPAGINLLGEKHTETTLDEVVMAVRSNSFIYEAFALDNLTQLPKLRKTYKKTIRPTAEKFGVHANPNLAQYGEESLFPKIGFAMETLAPYLGGASPMQQLTAPVPGPGPYANNYAGQPLQRYLKLGWAYARDIARAVQQQQQAAAGPVGIPPAKARLAATYANLVGQLGDFITSLPVDGYIGDKLIKAHHQFRLPLLAQFAQSCAEAMLELAIHDPSSRLTAAQQATLGGQLNQGAGHAQGGPGFFNAWRNHRFEDAVNAAAGNGVRYAGMGDNHLAHLEQLGLAANMHPFHMRDNDPDMVNFRQTTDTLDQAAQPF